MYKALFTRRDIEDIALKGYIGTENSSANCERCGLYKKVNSPRMWYTGDGRKNALVLAEAPGGEEDRLGQQLVGDSGQILRDGIKLLGLDLDLDFWKLNAVNCRPMSSTGSNRTPSDAEIKYCRLRVFETIRGLKPKVIWVFGSIAIQSLIGDKFGDKTMSLWRGLCIPDPDTNAWLIPMYHPLYIMRNSKDENLKSVWNRDLQFARDCLDNNYPVFESHNSKVSILWNYDDIITVLKTIIAIHPRHFYFDYETTGIKPHRPGHKIVSISFATSSSQSYSFLYDFNNTWTRPQLMEINRLFRTILLDENIGKACQNLSFEDLWSRVIMGAEPRHWIHDTQNTTHILDNRRHFTGLKMQAYINFGIYPYGGHLDKFIRSKKGSEFNTIEKAPPEDLLHYGGLDSYIGFRLMRKQMVQLANSSEGIRNANTFFLDGNKELADIHQNGICMNEDYYNEKWESMELEIKDARKDLLSRKEALKYKNKTGSIINLKSNQQMATLVYDILNFDESQSKHDKKRSVEEEAMRSLKLSFFDDVILYRKKEKIRNTYLAQFKREIVNGKMYPLYGLNIPITYRSSSQMPNFHNIPVRDEEAKAITRGGIIPSLGNKILEADFSSIEVCMSTCYHHDPNMIMYLTDPKSDMHRDTSMDIWMLPEEEIAKMIRSYSKNGFVFPEFYGSYYVNCARDLWKCVTEYNLKTTSGIYLRDHVKTVGIGTYEKFEDHLKEVEDIFWNKRFRVYKDWKEDIQKFYRKHGYIETHLGFRFTGYMGGKECTNYPIQGTAFHLLLWTLIRVNKARRAEGWKSPLIGQIHDSMLCDLIPDEGPHIMDTIWRIGVIEAQQLFDWIIVPLTIGFEMTPIDGSWNLKKEVEYKYVA